MYLQIFFFFKQYIILLEQEIILRCHAELMYTIKNNHNIFQDGIPSLNYVFKI